MGYWENTAYLAEGDPSLVAAALEAQLVAEGRRRVERPPARRPTRSERMQYEGALANELWGLAVFPGAAGWTVIKTAPFELLGERAPQQNAMRFQELSVRLGVAGFQIHVYDTTGCVLVEVDGRGGVWLSGQAIGASGDDPMVFHDEPLSGERLELRFEHLPLQALVEQCTRKLPEAMLALLGDGPIPRITDHQGLAGELAKQVGGANAAYCGNDTSFGSLIAHRPLPMPDGIELYFERPRA